MEGMEEEVVEEGGKEGGGGTWQPTMSPVAVRMATSWVRDVILRRPGTFRASFFTMSPPSRVPPPPATTLTAPTLRAAVEAVSL